VRLEIVTGPERWIPSNDHRVLARYPRLAKDAVTLRKGVRDRVRWDDKCIFRCPPNTNRPFADRILRRDREHVVEKGERLGRTPRIDPPRMVMVERTARLPTKAGGVYNDHDSELHSKQSHHCPFWGPDRLPA
jgi:hypothetical protein